ncbi:MAG TPA: class F sortase [Candidatus Sulfotelmatobacter sp.]|jgi:sortase A|nr:class F sortase [Candidatus Sulfotelmatobacter sp.]
MKIISKNIYKIRVGLLLFLITLALFSILFLSHLIHSIPKRAASQIDKVSRTSSGLPVRLLIPAINVNADIQYVGVTANGAMEVPNNIVDVGWFKLGSRPGEIGSAVISGHLDGKNGEAGVFANLDKLKTGEKIYIKDSKGTLQAFVVKESRIFNPGYVDKIFSKNDSAHLNLITCDGVWNKAQNSYSKRLVVFADITQ